MTYKFSVYNFSEQEIEQIVTLAKRWAKGDTWFPIDGRKFTKQVKEYACGWALLEKKNDRLYLASNSIFNPRYNLPTEALWRLVQPMLRVEGSTGYSIVNNPGWCNLNIYPQNNRSASDRDLREKEDILGELAGWQYIIFQSAGSVWSIYPIKVLTPVV